MNYIIKNKLIIIASVLFVLILTSIVIIKVNDTKNKQEISTNSETDNKVDSNTTMSTSNRSTADYIDHYDDFFSMSNAADIIIKGKMVDSYPEQRADLVFTNQVIKIEKIYKGNLNKGDKIQILQTGGSLNGITTDPFYEAPLVEAGDHYLLALRYTTEGHYNILGGYQGVGLIKDDAVKFNEENFEISEELNNKSFKDIENILKEYNTNNPNWTGHYSSFLIMEGAADLIITGKEVDSYTEENNDNMIEKQVIEIDKVYKGKLKSGDKVEVVQIGEILDDTTTPSPSKSGKLDRNCKYLLFLQSTPEGHYIIMGGNQGIGLIKENNIIFNDIEIQSSNELKDKSFKDIENMLIRTANSIYNKDE